MQKIMKISFVVFISYACLAFGKDNREIPETSTVVSKSDPSKWLFLGPAKNTTICKS